MSAIASFFIDNFPSPLVIAVGGPSGLIWAYACLYFSGWLKRSKGLQTGYTRKIFHFLIFMTVVFIHMVWGLHIVCFFGGMVSIVIFYAVVHGPGHPLYEAMAREDDEPHRTFHVVIPYFATLIGGVTSNILFGELAVVGYLVTGFGDAIGEMVGTRYGTHLYRVPSFRPVKAKRSYEGSGAVFIACWVAILFGIFSCHQLTLSAKSVLLAPLLALLCAGLEAISPRGSDNLVLQIIPSFLAGYLLR